ncbi:MAG: DUF4160 domain-containing protein [Chthoniobacteraceae bacterium]|nr:DUF4160 domain-containing protein [Chthoniobacteraceae bacterium]
MREANGLQVSAIAVVLLLARGPRIHVHVGSPNGEAKFWIEPTVDIASNHGLKDVELTELKQLIEERQNEIREHWNRHFGN